MGRGTVQGQYNLLEHSRHRATERILLTVVFEDESTVLFIDNDSGAFPQEGSVPETAIVLVELILIFL
jgi:hypothetical protein